MSEILPPVPAAWHPDPMGRHQYRYWDGAAWTDFVADDGVQSTDPLFSSTPTSQGASAEASLGTRSYGFLSRRANDAERGHRAMPTYLLIGADGYPGVEVEGEFARMGAIHAVLDKKPLQNQEIVAEGLIAELIPEPKNRFDANAVMVRINGQHVGYLSREDAARYQPILRQVVECNFVPATKARVWASARADWDSHRKLKYVAAIRLALNEPHLIVPLNDPPAEDHAILPWGNALQVTGEEHHQEVLADYVNAEGDGIAIGTLTIVKGGSARAPKDVVEIGIDGQRIGQLTSASSQHFIPTIRHLEAQHVVPAAWLRVKGSAIATQVTLQATKAHELPADWFESPESIPRLRPGVLPGRSYEDLDEAEIRTISRPSMWDEA